MEIINRRIICEIGGRYIAYLHGNLYLSNDLKKFYTLCELPISRKKKLLARFNITSRLFRLYPRAICRIDDQTFIFGFNGGIYNVNIEHKRIYKEHHFPEPMNTPLGFTKIEGVNGFDDCIVYGEYHANPQKRDMGIYARKRGKWSCVYSFHADQLLHIHGFCVDSRNDRVLILTGDKDEESCIYEAKNNFQEVRPLVKGDQVYRSCVAFAADKTIIYATDTPLVKNYIYRLTSDNKIQELFEMPGPSIFGAEVSNNNETLYYFATSVEPDSRLIGWRYLLSRKPGPGVKDNYCHIVCGNEEKGFKTILKLEKDWLPMTLFQFGNASFFVDEEGQLLILPQSIKKYNDKTIIV